MSMFILQRVDQVQVYTLHFIARPKPSTKVNAAVLAVALALSGCVPSSSTPLPDLKPVAADSMLKPAQQQQAIQDLARKKADEEAQAVKQIEKQR